MLSILSIVGAEAYLHGKHITLYKDDDGQEHLCYWH